MIVEHFKGKSECNTFEEMEEVLKIRTDKGVNEFIIYGKEQYPYMVMLVNNDYTYLHYYNRDGYPGFRSIENDTNLDINSNTIFYTNTDEEEVSIENGSIISLAKAIDAIKEFNEKLDMPKCINWDEL